MSLHPISETHTAFSNTICSLYCYLRIFYGFSAN